MLPAQEELCSLHKSLHFHFLVYRLRFIVQFCNAPFFCFLQELETSNRIFQECQHFQLFNLFFSPASLILLYLTIVPLFPIAVHRMLLPFALRA